MAITLIKAGKIRSRNGTTVNWTIPPATLAAATGEGKFNNLACFVDHAPGAEYPSLRNLAGVISEPHFDGSLVHATLKLYDRPDLQWLHQLLSEIAADYEAGQPVPDVGLSLSFYGKHSDEGGEKTTTAITHVESCDLVFGPAADGRIKNILCKQQEQNTMSLQEEVKVELAAEAAEAAQPPALDELTQRIEKLSAIATSQTAEKERAAIEALTAKVNELTAAVAQKEAATAVKGIRVAEQTTALDRFSSAIDWLFGVQGAAVPDPQYRKADMIYFALTGDGEFRGVFDPNRVQLASATTVTLPNLAVNAMNKVIMTQFSYLSAWRWYERITALTPNNGSLNAMQLLSFGGISNLPTVLEGGAYTELSVDDVKETASFVKKGGYVGITREMLKNSDIQRIQAVPKALAIAAVRTRSAAVSEIFTSNSGVGPTLAQDSTALFHTDHSNLATTALGTDATAWKAARTECFKHTEVNSGKVLGVYPKYLLVPADLYDTALSILGYGEGMPTSYQPQVEDRGFADPRGIPLAVPDWTDATDWAYIVDPVVFPVIHMSYSQQPGGDGHPAPELYSVVSETSGLMFTNDVLPIKVRDEWAVGVNGPRGIGKRNVA